MLKIFQLLFVTLLIVSIFSISSTNIIEKNSQTLEEKVIEESGLEKETLDKFINEPSLYRFAYTIKVYISFSVYSTKNFKYQHNLLRPPIYS